MDSSVIFIDGDEATASPPAKADRASGSRPATRARRGHRPPRRQAESYVGNVSVIVPGAAQLLRGEWRAALCALSLLGLFGTLILAAAENAGRLEATLPWLGLHPVLIVRAVIVFYVAAAAVHLANVVHAKLADTAGGVPPWLAGLASFVLPGLGQALNGNLGRALAFLGGVWCLAGAWFLRSPGFARLLEIGDAHLPVGVLRMSSPAILVGVAAVLWSIAVYDAASGAILKRQRP